MTYLHAVGVKLTSRGDTARLLDLVQTFSQCHKLVIYRCEGFRYWFGRGDHVIDGGVGFSEKVEHSLEMVS